jgi:hypothetical protein
MADLTGHRHPVGGVAAALWAAASLVAVATPGLAADRETLLWIGAASSSTAGADGALLGEERRGGVTAGGGFWWRFDRAIALGLDVRYTQKGSAGKVDTRFSEDATTPGLILDATVELNYIEVPLLLAGQLDFGAHSSVRGYFGPSANFLVSSKVAGTLNNSHFESDIADGLTGVDWGGVVGASYAYRLSSGAVVFDARWTISLRSVEDSPDLDADVKNNTFAFALGWAVPIRSGE